VEVLRECAILHNYVLNKDKILLDDEGDEDIKDGPVYMGYYPMQLDPNVEVHKIIIDRLHSTPPMFERIRRCYSGKAFLVLG